MSTAEAAQESDLGITFDAGDDDAPAQTVEVEQEAEADEKVEASTEDESTEGDDEKSDDDRVSFDERQQEKVDEILAKRTARYRSQIEELQKKADEAQQRMAEMPQQDSNVDPQTGEPIVPDPPDPFDSDYEQKLQQREEAIEHRALWRSQQQAQQAQMEARREQMIAEVNQQAASLQKRAADFGLSAQDVETAGRFIYESGGIDPQIAQDILKGEFDYDDVDVGPAIPHYLYQNPEELEKIQGMSATAAARYIDRKISPKLARKLKRKADPPPPPSATERGAGRKAQKGPAGATYE